MGTVPLRSDAAEEGQAAGAVFRISVQRLGGSEESVCVSSRATVQHLRDAIEAQCAMGVFAYRLTAGGSVLDLPSARLSDVGLQDGSVVVVTREFARNYSRITKFERVLKCGKYPNGVLINQRSELLVCHYWGTLSVYDSDYSLKEVINLPGQPAQMALAPNANLLVAFRGQRKVGVLSPDGELVRWIGSGEGAHGVASSGDRVFVSDGRSRGAVRVYRFDDGTLLQTLGGPRSPLTLAMPSGLAVVDDRLLAVAERGSNRVLLLSLDSLQLIGQLPREAVGDALLREPNDVAVDSAGNLLVMDTGNERIAVFREDGSLVASVMQGYFKDHGNTFSYLACNHDTGAIAVSNNDEHSVAVLAPLADAA